jgi:hypothetical protein
MIRVRECCFAGWGCRPSRRVSPCAEATVRLRERSDRRDDRSTICGERVSLTLAGVGRRRLLAHALESKTDGVLDERSACSSANMRLSEIGR